MLILNPLNMCTDYSGLILKNMFISAYIPSCTYAIIYVYINSMHKLGD